MSYISSSSGGTCYEKLFMLDKTCQVQIFRLQIMLPKFEVGTSKHNKIECEYVYDKVKGFKS